MSMDVAEIAKWKRLLATIGLAVLFVFIATGLKVVFGMGEYRVGHLTGFATAWTVAWRHPGLLGLQARTRSLNQDTDHDLSLD